MSENCHITTVTKSDIFGNQQTIDKRCGVWEYCTSSENGVLEQCDGCDDSVQQSRRYRSRAWRGCDCGEYRLRSLDDMEVEIDP